MLHFLVDSILPKTNLKEFFKILFFSIIILSMKEKRKSGLMLLSFCNHQKKNRLLSNSLIFIHSLKLFYPLLSDLRKYGELGFIYGECSASCLLLDFCKCQIKVYQICPNNFSFLNLFLLVKSHQKFPTSLENKWNRNFEIWEKFYHLTFQARVNSSSSPWV